MRNTEAFSSALDEVCTSFHAMDVALKHSAFLCGEQPGAEDILRFSLLQPLLYIFAPLWGYETPFFKNLPNVARWCNELRSRSSNPFSRLYHYQEHLYAFGVDAKRIFHNRRVVDEAIGLGLGSLSTKKNVTSAGDKKASGTSISVKARAKRKKKESVISSNICV